MRKLFGPVLRLGIAPGAVSLLAQPGRLGGARVDVLAEQPVPGPGGEFLGPALRALLAGQAVAGRPVTVVLADELCRLWQVTPPPAAARLPDIEAAAALRFHALYGEGPAAWQIAADWHATEPFFAAAVPRALLALVESVAVESRLHVMQVVPHFVTAWNRWCRAIGPGAWFGQLHDGLLTMAAIDGRQLRAVRSLQVPPGADHYWLTQMMGREALLLGLEAPARVQLCGELPGTLAKPAGAGQVAVTRLGAGQGDGLSATGRLALGGGA